MNYSHVPKLNLIFLGFVICSICLLSIGYSAFNSIILDISGEITTVPQSEVYITDIVYEDSTDADTENSKIERYYQSLMQSTVALGDSATSSITYNITVYNSSDSEYFFKEVEYSDQFYDNPNIVFELDGLKKWDTIESKNYLTFSITFHYLDNTIPDSKILNSYLNFRFIIGSIDNTNIETPNKKFTIYNAKIDNVQFDLTNANDFNVDINLKLDNFNIQTLSLEPSQATTINLDLTNMLVGLQANKEYPIIIEQTAPYTITKTTLSIVQVIPTITNYDLGLNTAGSEQDPYVLYKIEDIVRLAKNVNSGTSFANSHLKLLNDLDFNLESDYYQSNDTSFGDLNDNLEDSNQILNEMTTGTGFMSIGNLDNSFKGIFDGDNHTIANIYINKNNDDVDIGFFGLISDSTLKNITLTGNYVVGNGGGSLAGRSNGISNILNCHSNVTILSNGKGSTVSGLVGTAYDTLTVENSSNSGNVTNNDGGVSGLVGFVLSSTVTIKNSYNTGNIEVIGVDSNNQFAGGLISKDSSGGGTIIISNCYNSGNVSSISGSSVDNVGGLIAVTMGNLKIESSYNSGKVTGDNCVGGLIGSRGNYQALWGQNPVAGTIATITNSYNAGTLSGNDNIGGLIGHDASGQHTITNSYYLQSGTIPNIGNLTSDLSGAKTDAYMKSSEFANLLGDSFIMDYSP